MPAVTQSADAIPDEDFVDELVRIHADSKGDPRRFEEMVRHRYAGERVYIAREGWNNKRQRDDRIRAEANAGQSPEWIASRYSLSRSRVYSILADVDE